MKFPVLNVRLMKCLLRMNTARPPIHIRISYIGMILFLILMILLWHQLIPTINISIPISRIIAFPLPV